jgi:xanthine dehydrogenase YagS FAD-binding subunit
VVLPPPPAGASRYRKVRERASFAFALDGVVRDCRLALGGVAHVPWRASRVERALVGCPAAPEHFRRAADRELEEARPLANNGYKVPLVRNLIVRTLQELAS